MREMSYMRCQGFHSRSAGKVILRYRLENSGSKSGPAQHELCARICPSVPGRIESDPAHPPQKQMIYGRKLSYMRLQNLARLTQHYICHAWAHIDALLWHAGHRGHVMTALPTIGTANGGHDFFDIVGVSCIARNPNVMTCCTLNCHDFCHASP